MEPESPEPALAGAPVLSDRYEISRLLREELWGAVWLARDGLLGAAVGLKVLPREAPEWAGAQPYYRQEAALALTLRHPEILGIYHLEEAAAGLFLVEEPFAGESLQAQLARQPRLGLPQALALLDKLALILDFAHQRGVVHRGLNPHNILLEGVEVRLANFSFPGPQDGPVTALELRAYDAPEVIYGDGPTPASNIFSLGVLGFRLVAGSLPYALTFDEPFPYRVEELPPDLEEIPLSLQNLLLRCLAVDPEERFADAAAFLAQLRQVGGESAAAGGTDWKAATAGTYEPAAAAGSGSRLNALWLAGQSLAPKLKEAALLAGRAFLASPRRQLWSLGLVVLLVLAVLFRGDLGLNRELPKAPAPASAVTAPPPPGTGIPPLMESEGPAAAPSPPAPAPAGPPEAAKAREERFMLVAATYGAHNQARALAQRLRKDHFQARIVSRRSGGKTQYQVQVGPVTGAKAAAAEAQRLKTKERITPRVVKIAVKTKPGDEPAARRAAR